MNTDKYTIQDAREEIGNSLDWELARQASLKKWRQIASGDEETYRPRANCGYCFVRSNRFGGADRCLNCPASYICWQVESWRPARIIEAIEAIEHPKED